MLSILSKFSTSTGLIIALMIALAGSAWRVNSLKADVSDRDFQIIQIKVKLEKWVESANHLKELTEKQNKSVVELAALGEAAQKRAVEAIKKAQPILEARQAQKNKAAIIGIELNTCEAAVERAKSDLAGSLL
jgi:phosphohistidine swiveling domain-containing protein